MSHIDDRSDDRSRFVRKRISADPHGAARIRADFRSWLDRHFRLGSERLNDLLLALNEAVANAAEFAYRDVVKGGTMDVSAAYDAGSDTLTVTVRDRGRWRDTAAAPVLAGQGHSVRGRGIPLMRALADEAVIDGTPHGTQVRLTWNQLTA